jgi:hypothetical protein
MRKLLLLGYHKAWTGYVQLSGIAQPVSTFALVPLQKRELDQSKPNPIRRDA